MLWDSGCKSTIVMVNIVEKLHPNKNDVMHWHTQAGNITTNLKVEVRLPWLLLAWKMSWRGKVMWMTHVRVDIMWS